jgi:hypothetical protein
LCPCLDLEDFTVSLLDLETMHPLDPLTLIGKTVADAGAQCEAANRPWRVFFEDGVSYPVTADFRPGRVNLAVEKGKVTDVEIEGEPATTA